MPSQLVKSTCQVEYFVKWNLIKWDLSTTKKMCQRQPAILIGEGVCKIFQSFFLRVLVCLKAVFLDGQDVKYDRDITPSPHFFHRTNSHEATQVVRRKWG